MSSKRKQQEQTVDNDIPEYPLLMLFEDKLSQLVVTLCGGVNPDGIAAYHIFATTRETTDIHLAEYDNYQEAVLKFGEAVAEFTKQTLNGSITNLGLPS